MASQSGRKLVLEYSADGGTTWNAIAGVREKSFSETTEFIDITDDDDTGNTSYLNDIASKGSQLTVSGVTKDGILKALSRDAGDGTAFHDMRLVDPTVPETATGEMGISNYEQTGSYQDAVMFSCTLVVNGVLVVS